MSHISDSEIKKLPKKPLNAYFKFRGERLVYHAKEEDRTKLVKQEWDELPEKEKQKMED
jgi:hypothetical protein